MIRLDECGALLPSLVGSVLFWTCAIYIIGGLSGVLLSSLTGAVLC